MDRILILEDDLSLIDGLSYAFEKQGYAVVVAKTVAEAAARWHESEYALLIVDVTLPDGTGFDFCKYVRLSSRVPRFLQAVCHLTGGLLFQYNGQATVRSLKGSL